METSLAAVALVFAARAWACEQHARSLFYTSVAASIRIEFNLLFLMHFAWQFYTRSLKLSSIWSILPWLTSATFDLIFYRTLLPHAVGAKSLAYHFPYYDAIVHTAGLGLSSPAPVCGVLFGVLMSIRVCSHAKQTHRDRAANALYVQAFALLAAWALSRSLVFSWYVALFSVCTSLAVALSFDGQKNAERFCACALLLSVGWFGFVGLRADFGGASNQFATGIRALRYRQLAAGLYAECPRCTLASSEIGGLGYGFRGRVYDALALADDAAKRFHPLLVPAHRASYHAGAIPPDYITLRKPDFVVSMPVFSEAFRQSDAVHTFDRYTCPLGDGVTNRRLWGDQSIQVFAPTTFYGTASANELSGELPSLTSLLG